MIFRRPDSNLIGAEHGLLERVLDGTSEAFVLDVGCGRDTRIARTHASKIAGAVGVDRSFVLGSGNKDLDYFIEWDVHDEPPMFQRKFDLVRLSFLVEHLRDPALALRNITSLVCDGGHLLVTTPTLDSAITRMLVRLSAPLRAFRRHLKWSPLDSHELHFKANTRKILDTLMDALDMNYVDSRSVAMQGQAFEKIMPLGLTFTLVDFVAYKIKPSLKSTMVILYQKRPGDRN